MTDLGFWADMMKQTLRDPRAAAGRLLATNPPMEARWLGLVLVAVLSLIVTTVLIMSMPPGNVMAWEGFISSPWTGLPAQVFGGIVMAFGLYRIGAFFGGAGRFADALLCIVWVNAVQVVFMVAQLVATFLPLLVGGLVALFWLSLGGLVASLSPLLGGLVAVLSFGVFFWILTQFTCALHGFRSSWKVFFGILASIVLFILVLSTLSGLLVALLSGSGA